MQIIKRIAVLAALAAATPASADTIKNAHDRVTVVAPQPNAELAAHRAQAIAWLHEYREHGIYPTDPSGVPLGVFMDAHQVRCPMAELIHKSGHDDLVTAVVAKANDLRLADVHAGPLYDWMLHSGLTRDEIVMVQGAMEMNGVDSVLAIGNPELGRAKVTRRLVYAETVLRRDTDAALKQAAQQLATPYVATGPVVSDALLKVTELRRMAAQNPRRNLQPEIDRALLAVQR